jgi:hypothetical protein
LEKGKRSYNKTKKNHSSKKIYSEENTHTENPESSKNEEGLWVDELTEKEKFDKERRLMERLSKGQRNEKKVKIAFPKKTNHRANVKKKVLDEIFDDKPDNNSSDYRSKYQKDIGDFNESSFNESSFNESSFNESGFNESSFAEKASNEEEGDLNSAAQFGNSSGTSRSTTNSTSESSRTSGSNQTSDRRFVNTNPASFNNESNRGGDDNDGNDPFRNRREDRIDDGHPNLITRIRRLSLVNTVLNTTANQ